MSKLGLTRPTQTVELCTNLGLVAEHERLSAALDAAKKDPGQADRLNSSAPGIANQIRDLETQMREHTVVFTLAALPRKEWTEFEAAHPKRPGNDLDETFNVNMDTFVDAVMAASITSVVSKGTGEPVDFTGADWAEESEGLTDGQWSDFALKVITLNRGVKTVPFSRAASAQTRRSEQNSK